MHRKRDLLFAVLAVGAGMIFADVTGPDHACNCPGGCGSDGITINDGITAKVNVAYGKPASFSSFLHDPSGEMGHACTAVNGRVHASWKGVTQPDANCIHTAVEDKAAWWKVDLGETHTVQSINIYGREGWSNRMASMTVEVDDEVCYTFPNDTSHFEDKTVIKCAQPLTGHSVTLRKHRDLPYDENLINVCEVQVWICAAEGTYGEDCNVCGHCSGDGTCDKVTGACPEGCQPGFDPSDPLCKRCPKGFYGDKCASRCENCFNDLCHQEDGVCHGLCKPGFDFGWGFTCETPCHDGTYGQGCTEACGHCSGDVACDKVTGVCPEGCQPGFEASDPLCKLCVGGTYGENCEHVCGHCSGDGVCDSVTGACPEDCQPGFEPSDPLCKQHIVFGFEWESLPDDYVYACTGGRAEFRWGFKTTEDLQILSVNWIHDGGKSSSMVATMARDHFVATAGYSARVRHVGNGGLVLKDLMAEDSGNYTIEVNMAEDRGMFQSLRKTVYLQVGDGLMVEGELTVVKEEGILWDETSQQWFIRLTCGSFTFLGPPPLDVVWITPDGKTRPSSEYKDGRFFLSLTTPVRGGNYTCAVSPAHLPVVCYKDQGGKKNQVVSASVTVNGIKARLSLLEANQKALRKDFVLKDNLTTLDEDLQSLQQNHLTDSENVTEYCQEVRSSMQQQMEVMQEEMQAMQEQVEVLWNKTHHVPLSGPCLEENHKVITDQWRLTSEAKPGSNCDSSLNRGWYRFKVGDKNAVIPTTCVPTKHCNTYAPMWLDLQGESLPDAVNQEKDARACAHWDSNCCNWKSAITVRNCGHFFVYNLQPRSECSLAFCVEYQSSESEDYDYEDYEFDYGLWGRN